MENEVTDLPLMCPMCQSMSKKTLQKNEIMVLTHWNSFFSLFSVSSAEYRGTILEILER